MVLIVAAGVVIALACVGVFPFDDFWVPKGAMSLTNLWRHSLQGDVVVVVVVAVGWVCFSLVVSMVCRGMMTVMAASCWRNQWCRGIWADLAW